MGVQYCLTPSHPIVTNVGVRLVVYIQAVLNVVLGVVCRLKYGYASGYLQNIFAIQLSILVASIIYATFGLTHLSTFHQLVAVDLAEIGFMSVLAACAIAHMGAFPIQPSLRRRLVSSCIALIIWLMTIAMVPMDPCVDYPAMPTNNRMFRFGGVSTTLHTPGTRKILPSNPFIGTISPLAFVSTTNALFNLVSLAMYLPPASPAAVWEKIWVGYLILNQVIVSFIRIFSVESALSNASVSDSEGWEYAQLAPLSLLLFSVALLIRECRQSVEKQVDIPMEKLHKGAT